MKAPGEVDTVNTVNSEVNAAVHHRPQDGSRLVLEAWAEVGSQAVLAARCGVHRDTLRKLVSGEHQMSYPMQVTLERIIREG